jgi:hypothetical protein
MDDYYTKQEVNTMIANLATKKDIEGLAELMKNINLGVGIFKGGIHTVIFIGSLAAGVASMLVLIKIGIAGVIAWALHK